MEEIVHHLDVQNPVNNGTNYQAQLVSRISSINRTNGFNGRISWLSLPVRFQLPVCRIFSNQSFLTWAQQVASHRNIPLRDSWILPQKKKLIHFLRKRWYGLKGWGITIMGFMTPFNKVGYLFPGRFWVAAWGGCGSLTLQGPDTFEWLISSSIGGIR